jgi:hypothetical protein
MATDDNNATRRRGSWGGIISLVTVHLLAFAMLYLVLVQIAYAFDDHYKLVGFATTERFSSVLQVSNYVAGYTWLVLCVVAADVYVVYRLARNGSRWTSAYSHTALLSIGFLAFLSVAWMIHPMVWSRPGAANAPVADAEPTDTNSTVAFATPNDH